MTENYREVKPGLPGFVSPYFGESRNSPCCKTVIDCEIKRSFCPCCIRLSNKKTLKAECMLNDDREESYLMQPEARPALLNMREDIVNGWLYKKGSGRGFLGTQNYKPRFIKLTQSLFEGYSLELPALHSYWSEDPFTLCSSILLDGCIAVPVDRKTMTGSRLEVSHGFDLIFQQQSRSCRSFAACAIERDKWVVQINRAVASYARTLAKYRRRYDRKSERRTLPPLP